ncbi:transcriptional regulator of fucose utilization, GntR family [Formosa agariphila KMM 3901]|uniref:Transcriptional regulator of fucose utilization, GntR family n=1 Tax=Formosa agariphila (strain DSM 15362 / KCTC 12365 / LMG 23005 / KMM 3901 / M-2Alg 35-1) TaxID=1347342 RepID=T2KJR6_FORAG|nr:GntR family transcriptional regulator [Formosa agariphila]CDF78661.1 transcriptional regulator of fucose utilization, GntR family [Formosa agariphila KMM 3901]
MSVIKIKKNKSIPKYKQIIESIEGAINSGELKKGDQLPSINNIRDEHKVSRDTVLTAFNELKARGIIQAVVGKGYYVLNDNVDVNYKIFLLFDELNSFKEDLYNSFINNLDSTIRVDIYFHHFNEVIFRKLISENVGLYNYYVIMPANLKDTHLVIENLPQDKVYVLDQTHPELSQYSAIFQNFEKDIYNNLTEALPLIQKYSKIILHFSEASQPEGMRKGFIKFCKENAWDYEVISSLKDRVITKGEVYVLPDDKNLLRVIKGMKQEQLTLSKDVGIISYNDTLLKEIVEGGITTISTDFKQMGERLAQMILHNEQLQIENINTLILRNSL